MTITVVKIHIKIDLSSLLCKANQETYNVCSIARLLNTYTVSVCGMVATLL